jgi:hypothetical protein
MMEFTDGNVEEEKEELSDELVASLKQKITALQEQVTELHLMVYDQQTNFGVIHKVTTSKLKRFAKALGDPSLYNAPSPLGSSAPAIFPPNVYSSRKCVVMLDCPVWVRSHGNDLKLLKFSIFE